MGSRGLQGLAPEDRSDVVELWQRIARHLFAARVRAELYQRQVARRMGTKTSGVSRLENARGYPPDLVTLYKYAQAVRCRLEIRLVPIDWREGLDDSGAQ